MAGVFLADAAQMEFAPDALWDDDEEWDFGGADDGDVAPGREAVAPRDDAVVIDQSNAWVDGVLADLGLDAPAPSPADGGAAPRGPLRYAVDRATGMEDAYAAYWGEVCRLEGTGPDAVGATLHILPDFCRESVQLFEQWADTLAGAPAALGAAGAAPLRIHFYHPQWTFRDAWNVPEATESANYARRSPWPMVSLLRAEHVDEAPGGGPAAASDRRRDAAPGGASPTPLEKLLRLADLKTIEGMRIARREGEAPRAAEGIPGEGGAGAAPRVDRSQIGEQDMAAVLLQALKIRLGKEEAAAGTAAAGTAAGLSGAQTSATLMAADFLLKELCRIAEE